MVALTLLATVDDRHVGRAADERQMIWTAVALAETGQMAQARGRDFNYVRADGEAVSRFGLGMTLVQVPAAFLAPVVERVRGAGSSQPLFLIAPILLVLVAGQFAARAARSLGGGARAGTIALVLCGIGSPLGSYAATGLSEPLQAASLAAAYALALSRRAFLSGMAVSCALLTKSSLIVVAPAALLPLLAPSATPARTWRVRNALLGFLPGAVVWAYFEMSRFGRLFGSYPGERFNHPFFDGLWRLTVGPNFGFFLFFPAAIVALAVCVSRIANRTRDEALAMMGAVAPFFILLCLAAPWWAWHGVWGWGPRLIVPAVPLMAACAAIGVAAWPPMIGRSFMAVSIAINLIGLLQHPVPVAKYEASVAWPVVPAEVASALPGYAWRLEPDGTYRISPDHVLAEMPRASQFIVFPWFRWATQGSNTSATARAFEAPPWRDDRPDLVPWEMPVSEPLVHDVTGYPRARFWGRGFFPTASDAAYAAVYDEALADQVIRLQQKRDGAAALGLVLRLVDRAPIACYDGLVIESYRLLGDRFGARAYLDQLPRDRRVCATINVALALFQRDAGDAAGARQLLDSVAYRFPADAPLQRALKSDLSSWPADLQSMIALPVKAAGE